MNGDFRETASPADVNPTEIGTQAETQSPSEVPTLSELEGKMQDLFPQKPSDGIEQPETSQDELVESPDNGRTITLDDGTKVDLPEGMSGSIGASETSDLATSNESNKFSKTDDNEKVNDTDPKTDDNGKIYMDGGRLMPNSKYELNGNIYTTDDKGRIVRCESKPKLTPENPRDNIAQREVGGEDRKENDQGGHIVGRDLNGDGGVGNLLAMNPRINQSDYKRMENDIKGALNDGKDVNTETEITYKGDSDRPDIITVTVITDGKVTIHKFDNNIDNSLMDAVPEKGQGSVQSELDQTDGFISSIKEEYDENGNLVRGEANIITYTDEGSIIRTKAYY